MIKSPFDFALNYREKCCLMCFYFNSELIIIRRLTVQRKKLTKKLKTKGQVSFLDVILIFITSFLSSWCLAIIKLFFIWFEKMNVWFETLKSFDERTQKKSICVKNVNVYIICLTFRYAESLFFSRVQSFFISLLLLRWRFMYGVPNMSYVRL